MGFWKKFFDRNERLILTLISKQWLVFFLSTVLLYKKLITAELWMFLACYVIGVNVYQKYKGVSDGNPSGNK